MTTHEKKKLWNDFMELPEQVMPYFMPPPEPRPKGVRFWEASPHTGRKKLYSDVDEFVSACQEYFEWNEQNPLMSAELVSFKGESVLEDVPKIRALTIQGLCLFIGISNDTWANYKKNGSAEFKEACVAIHNIIYQQKITGAAAGLLNANIISRELGLKDCTDVSSKDGSMSPPRNFNEFYSGNKKNRKPTK
jgi:hypothetical protein